MELLVKPVVRTYINKWDPMGLLVLGAPDDEYETEIDDITCLFMEHSDKAIIAEDIQMTFQQTLEHNSFFQKCLSVTETIWNEAFE